MTDLTEKQTQPTDKTLKAAAAVGFLLFVFYLTATLLMDFELEVVGIIGAFIDAIFIILIASKQRQARILGCVLFLCRVIMLILLSAPSTLLESLAEKQLKVLYIWASSFLPIIILAVSALCISRLTGGLRHKKNVFLIYALFAGVQLFFRVTVGLMHNILSIRMLMSLLFSALVPQLIALFIVWYALYATQPEIRLGSKAKGWCWLCVIVTSVSVVALLVTGRFIGRLLFSVGGVVGYIFLIRGKKWGFWLICGLLISLLSYDLTSYDWIPLFITNLVSLINPLITGIVINSAWKSSNTEFAAAAQPV